MEKIFTPHAVQQEEDWGKKKKTNDNGIDATSGYPASPGNGGNE